MNYPITFGKYLLLERINVGGMAEVFKAKAFGVEGFERILAIKRILPNMADDDEFINMFVDEARIAVQLSHANVVQIYELGKFENQYYIAMEYVSGKDLRQILDRFRKRKQTLPLPAAAFLTSKICEGLDYAHRKADPAGRPLNLIHRDVSPQNILVSFEGAVKITDFGIAKAEDRASKTQAGVLKGKFGYMSPEQVRGLDIDHRSDIFAVGILMYEMLTGKRLFIGESDFSTLEKVRNAEVVPPSEHNPAISPELERCMLKALARERDDRYQWASELHDDLQQFLIEDNTIYNAKRLSTLLRDEFNSDIEAEMQKMEEFMRMPAPSSAEAHAAARQMVNAPRRDQGVPAGEKTMIFESVAELANAPTQIGEGLEVATPPTPRRADEAGTGSVIITAPPRAESQPLASSKVASVVKPKANKGRAAALAFSAVVVLAVAGLAYLFTRATAAVGTMIVVTQPVDQNLEIILDGKVIGGSSPLIRDDVPLGEHHLLVRAPGYREKIFNVPVTSGAAAYVEVKFGAPIAASSGEVEITSEPSGAMVIVDGLNRGVTPMTLRDRDTQKPVLVLLQKEGYETEPLRATFPANETKTRLTAVMRPVTARAGRVSLRVESTPDDASIYLNGKRFGTTPRTIDDLDPKEPVEVKVVKQGYEAQSTRVVFDGRPTETRVFTLQQERNDVVHVKVGGLSKDTRSNDPKPPPKNTGKTGGGSGGGGSGGGTGSGSSSANGGNSSGNSNTANNNSGSGTGTTSGGSSGCSGEASRLSVAAHGEANCQVQIGGKKLGLTPIFKSAAPTGRCEVKVTCPSGKSYRQLMTLKSGDDQKIIVKPGMWQQ